VAVDEAAGDTLALGLGDAVGLAVGLAAGDAVADWPGVVAPAEALPPAGAVPPLDPVDAPGLALLPPVTA
jgi:hypothetical protein